jgi:hypothetical protein
MHGAHAGKCLCARVQLDACAGSPKRLRAVRSGPYLRAMPGKACMGLTPVNASARACSSTRARAAPTPARGGQRPLPARHGLCSGAHVGHHQGRHRARHVPVSRARGRLPRRGRGRSTGLGLPRHPPEGHTRTRTHTAPERRQGRSGRAQPKWARVLCGRGRGRGLGQGQGQAGRGGGINRATYLLLFFVADVQGVRDGLPGWQRGHVEPARRGLRETTQSEADTHAWPSRSRAARRSSVS